MVSKHLFSFLFLSICFVHLMLWMLEWRQNMITWCVTDDNWWRHSRLRHPILSRACSGYFNTWQKCSDLIFPDDNLSDDCQCTSDVLSWNFELVLILRLNNKLFEQTEQTDDANKGKSLEKFLIMNSKTKQTSQTSSGPEKPGIAVGRPNMFGR